jgi:hypothetical protein
MTRQPTAIPVYKIDVADQVYWGVLVPRKDGYCTAVILGEGKKREGYRHNGLFNSIKNGREVLQKFMDDNVVLLINGQLSKYKSIGTEFSSLEKHSIKRALTKLNNRK